jgi:hypothetical protein
VCYLWLAPCRPTENSLGATFPANIIYHFSRNLGVRSLLVYRSVDVERLRRDEHEAPTSPILLGLVNPKYRPVFYLDKDAVTVGRVRGNIRHNDAVLYRLSWFEFDESGGVGVGCRNYVLPGLP